MRKYLRKKEDMPDRVFMPCNRKGELPDRTWFNKGDGGYSTIKFLSGRVYKKSFSQVKKHLAKQRTKIK